MKKRISFVLILTTVFYAMLANVILAAPLESSQEKNVLPLTQYSAQYDYSPSYAQRLREWVDGNLFYGYDYEPASFESFAMNAQVPGDVLNGGTLSVNLQAANGNSYNFELPELIATEEALMFGSYVYEDRSSGITVTVYPNPNGEDTVSLTKNAGIYDINRYSDGQWGQSTYTEGVFTLNETESVSFSVEITNNAGEEYGVNDTISLDYTPTSYDDTWNYKNRTTHSWGFMEKFAGVQSSYH